MKHNKKRNTLFLYDLVTKKYTEAVLSNNSKVASELVGVIKESFGRNTSLGKACLLYRNAKKADSLTKTQYIRMLSELKREYQTLDLKAIFEEQTSLIRWINKNLGKSTWTSFVPNYTTTATIDQLFNNKNDHKNSVLLEANLADQLLTESKTPENNKVEIDSIVFKESVKKFNEKYKNKLTTKQTYLLNQYISSSLTGDKFDLLSCLSECKVGMEKKLNLLKESNESSDGVVEKIEEAMGGLTELLKEDVGEKTIRAFLMLEEIFGEIEC